MIKYRLDIAQVTVANVFSDEWEELNSLDLSVDESYSLSITATDLNDTVSCDIQANTVWGGSHIT